MWDGINSEVGDSIFNFLRQLCTVFHHACITLHPHQPCTVSNFSASLTTFAFFFFSFESGHHHMCVGVTTESCEKFGAPLQVRTRETSWTGLDLSDWSQLWKSQLADESWSGDQMSSWTWKNNLCPLRRAIQLLTEKAMAPHSSTLAWKIPWTKEPGGLQSMGSLRVGHNWATSLSLFTFMLWRRKWQPTPVFLPGESRGRGSLVGCRLWGRTESDTTEVTQQQQQHTAVKGQIMESLGKSRLDGQTTPGQYSDMLTTSHVWHCQFLYQLDAGDDPQPHTVPQRVDEKTSTNHRK